MFLTILMRLLKPGALLSGGAIGLILLVLWVGLTVFPNRRAALPWVIITCLIIAVVYFVVLFLVREHRSRKAKQLEKSIEAQAQAQIAGARPGREQEIEQIRKQLLEAVDALKRSKLGKSKGGEGALYVLPWYMIIGPPASGKTTLLQNGGLSFPYVDPSRTRGSVKGVGGTRNCDWWFAEEAVLLDTAGRYILPVEADDTKEWLAFLDLLKKNRGKQPINGLIVAVSVSDLLAGGEESVDDHANKIRTRVDELIKQLGVTFPVYVLFTKCDLVSGFVEFFSDFSKAERAAVWGATLSRERSQRTPAERLFEEEFDRLVEAVHELKIPRVAQLGKPEGRSEVLFFPLQFQSLRNRLSRFHEILFRANPYQEVPVFRGFYFTSGTQEGRPIDSVINSMMQGFGISAGSGEMYVQPSQTKSYFIEEVFSKVAFPDRHMGGPSVEGERRRRDLRVRFFTTGCVVLGLFTILLVVLSGLNGALIRETARLGRHAQAMIAGSGELQPGDLVTLDHFRDRLVALEGRQKTWPVFLGTFQGNGVLEQGRKLYLVVLHDAALKPALPALANRLDNPDPKIGLLEYIDTYRAWRVTQDPAVLLSTEADARRTALVMTRYWSGRQLGTTGELEPLMVAQLDYARRWQKVWADLVRPDLDRGVDARAQAWIRDRWSAEGFYPSLEQAGAGAPEITVAGASGSDPSLSGQFAVPGAFTRQGWTTGVKPTVDFIEAVREDWALKDAYPNAPSLRYDLLARYADQYTRAWTHFMSGVEVKSSSDPKETKKFLEKAAGTESPLRKLIEAIDANTNLGRDTDPGLRSLEGDFAAVHELLFKAEKGRLPVISNLNFRGGGDKGPFQDYQAKLNAVSEKYIEITEARDPANTPEVLELTSWVDNTVQPQKGDVNQALADLLNVSVSAVAGTAKKIRSANKGAALASGWSDVYRQYQNDIEPYYPITPGGDPLAIKSFEEFFGPSGTFWAFYEENLKEVVSEDGRNVKDAGASLRPEFLKALGQAYEIRKACFDGDRAGFTVSLRTTAPQRDPATGIVPRTLRFDMGGKSFLYSMGQAVWTPMAWPGDNPDEGAQISVDAGSTATVNALAFDGVWGFFRLLDRSKNSVTESGSISFTWRLDSDKGPVQVSYSVQARTNVNPAKRDLLRFRCPAEVWGTGR